MLGRMGYLDTRHARRAAARTSPQARDYMTDVHQGWRIVSGKGGGWADRCGLVAHRGVLHPDEYVDMAVLVPAVEQRLGFTMAEVRSVYRGRGRRTAAQIDLRACVDARLLDIRRAGGNLELLARAVGVDRKVIGRALVRARPAP
jgi:hypothetical protein